MKFSKIALSAAVVIGVVAISASWYTGKEVENRYLNLFQSTNKQLKELEQQGIFAEITDVKFQRHFFSSDLTYRLVAKNESTQLVLNGEDKIYHGPLPLNRLSQFKLLPVLASWKSSIMLPEQWQKKLQRSQLGEGVADVTYAGVIDGKFDIEPFNYQDEDGNNLEVSAIKTQYSYQLNSAKDDIESVKGELSAEKFNFSDDNAKIAVSGIDYRFNHIPNKDYPSLSIGDAQVTIKQIKGSAENEVAMKDIDLQFSAKVKGERLLSDAIASFTSLSVDQKEFGSMRLVTDLNLDAELYQEFQKLVSSGEVDTEIFGDLALNLLAKQPKFNIKELKLENAGGKANLALALNPNTFTLENMQDNSDVLKALGQSSLDITLDRDYITHLIQAINNATKAEAEQGAESLITLLVENGLASREGNNAKGALNIDNGKITLNGKELSDDDWQSLLFMLAMLGMF